MRRLALLGMLLLAGCAAAEAGPLVVTDAQNGGSVTLARDRQLVLRLAANASTGYAWSVTQSANLRLVSHNYLWPGGAPGAAGTQEYVFAPAGTGEARLALAYRRPWEAAAAPARAFTLAILIR
jgi:inhibitor of cysteine peptidase